MAELKSPSFALERRRSVDSEISRFVVGSTDTNDFVSTLDCSKRELKELFHVLEPGGSLSPDVI
jgi:hypothetical protein